jgi:hypothetical protein
MSRNWAPWDEIHEDCTFFCEDGCGREWVETASLFPDEETAEATCTCGKKVTTSTLYAVYTDRASFDAEYISKGMRGIV